MYGKSNWHIVCLQFCITHSFWHFKTSTHSVHIISKIKFIAFPFPLHKMSFRLATKAHGFVWLFLRSTYTTITTSRFVNLILPCRSFHVLANASGISNCVAASPNIIEQSCRRSQSTTITDANVPIASYDDIKDLPNHPEIVLIDVRETLELQERGAIPNCLNIPRE